MVKWFEIFFPALFVISAITPYAHAITVRIDLAGVINAINGGTSSNSTALTTTTNTLNGTLLDIPTQLLNLLLASIKNSLINFNNTLNDLTQQLLATNPDPTGMMGWWQSVVIIISSLYLLLFLIIGLQFLLSSDNPTRREESKQNLKNAVIMIIGVNISFYLYKLVLELSTGITSFMWSVGFEQFFQNDLFASTSIIFLSLNIFSIGLALLTLFVRYLFLLAGVALFPIGIFLYLTPKFETWGKMIFNFLGVMLALQFIDVIIIISTQQVLIQLAGNAGTPLILPLGFVVIALTNTLAIIYALVKSALTITTNAPALNLALSTLTGNIVGAIGSAKQTGAVSPNVL